MVKKATNSGAAASSSSDGGKSLNWVTILKRVPQVNKTSDASDKLRRDPIRSQFIDLLRACDSDESLVTTVQNYVSGGMFKKAKDGPRDEWPSQYKKLYRLPKSWMGLQMLRCSGKTLTAAMIKAVDAKDADAIATGWFMVNQVKPEDPWPEVLLNKSYNDEFWDRRTKECGMLAAFIRSIGADGSVNWKTAATYKVIFAGTKAHEIQAFGRRQVHYSRGTGSQQVSLDGARHRPLQGHLEAWHLQHRVGDPLRARHRTLASPVAPEGQLLCLQCVVAGVPREGAAGAGAGSDHEADYRRCGEGAQRDPAGQGEENRPGSGESGCEGSQCQASCVEDRHFHLGQTGLCHRLCRYVARCEPLRRPADKLGKELSGGSGLRTWAQRCMGAPLAMKMERAIAGSEMVLEVCSMFVVSVCARHDVGLALQGSGVFLSWVGLLVV